jgi:hypothetical protein
VLHRAVAGAGYHLGEAPTCGHDAPNASSTPPIAYCGGSAYPPQAGVADFGAKVHLLGAGPVLTEEHGRGVRRWLGPAHPFVSAPRIQLTHTDGAAHGFTQRRSEPRWAFAGLRGHRSVAQKLGKTR